MPAYRRSRLRRVALAGSATLLLAGCSSDSGDWKQYMRLVRQAFSAGTSTQGVTREQAAAIPYASMGYRINGGDEAVLVLATDDGANQLWTAASHIVLLTRGGRIVRSVGLPHDLSATVAEVGDSLPALAEALKAPFHSRRLVDLPDLGAYSVALNCQARSLGAQTISIIGASIATVRVGETCQSVRPRWSFTDYYWLDAGTGLVWHSVQNVAPSVVVQTEILRPPG